MIAHARVILIATENDHLRQAVAASLVAQGHQVRLAGGAVVEREEPVACLVLEADLGSPGVTRLLADLTEREPGLPVVLVQSDADIRGWGAEPHGGFRGYLPAPFDARALVALVDRAIRNAPPATVSVSAQDEAMPPQRLAARALEALVHAMEAKDPHLPGHSLRVAELAAAIAAMLGRTQWEVEEVRLAGRLHDLGMIALRDQVVTKAGALTREEYAEVKRHPVLGHDILSGYPYMERVARYIRGHHERWDGTGYPDGLAGEAIPWGAQVLAAAETFDAMTSKRAYRSANSLTQTLDRMFAQTADAIDPGVMNVLGRVVSQRRTLSFMQGEDGSQVERNILAENGGRREGKR